MQDLMQPIGTPDGLFHDGNPATGELGTIVSALWLNALQGATRSMQSELLSVLTAAGVAIDPAKTNQVLDAIKKIAWGGTGAARPTTLAGYGITDAIPSSDKGAAGAEWQLLTRMVSCLNHSLQSGRFRLPRCLSRPLIPQITALALPRRQWLALAARCRCLLA